MEISNRQQLATRYQKHPATISRYIKQYEQAGYPVGRSNNAVYVVTEDFDRFMIEERGKNDNQRSK